MSRQGEGERFGRERSTIGTEKSDGRGNLMRRVHAIPCAEVVRSDAGSSFLISRLLGHRLERWPLAVLRGRRSALQPHGPGHRLHRQLPEAHGGHRLGEREAGTRRRGGALSCVARAAFPEGSSPGLLSSQIGSYFGSVLCSLDVDRDGVTDLLLVGAPMFMSELKKEEGRVYVFSVTKVTHRSGAPPSPPSPLLQLVIFSPKGILNEQGFLSGPSPTEDARFGMAISAVPDLDLDGYSDVVVGAPLEDNQRGVIYIYNGEKKALKKEFSQVWKAWAPLELDSCYVMRLTTVSCREFPVPLWIRSCGTLDGPWTASGI